MRSFEERIRCFHMQGKPIESIAEAMNTSVRLVRFIIDGGTLESRQDRVKNLFIRGVSIDDIVFQLGESRRYVRRVLINAGLLEKGELPQINGRVYYNGELHDRNKIILELIEQGYTRPAVAEVTGVPLSTVYKIAKHVGPNSRYKKRASRESLQSEYVDV